MADEILVTGADGYIGARMVPHLRAHGHDVVGLDTEFFADGWLSLAPERRSAIQADVRRLEARICDGFDGVVHLADLSNDPLGEHNPAVTYQINHAGTVRLARLAKAAGVSRFVYSSSCSVYGVGDDRPRTETSAVNPQTAYAQCKVLVERDVAAMADDDFSPTFLRNATAFGPSPRMRFDVVLNNLTGHAWTARQLVLTSDGTPWRPIVHLLDICEAFACALVAPRQAIHNQVFNVGNSAHNYRVREIAEIVSSVVPDCSLTIGTSGGDNRSYRVDFEKIHTMLPGYQCQRDAATGVRELLAQFEAVGLTRDDFEFRAYTRLKQLRHLADTGQIDDQFFWIQKHDRQADALTSPESTAS